MELTEDIQAIHALIERIYAFHNTQPVHEFVINGDATNNSNSMSWWEHLSTIQRRGAEVGIWESTYALEFMLMVYPDIEQLIPSWKVGEDGIEFTLFVRQAGDGVHYSNFDDDPPQWALEVDTGTVFSWAMETMDKAINNSLYDTFEMANMALSGNPTIPELKALRASRFGALEREFERHGIENDTPQAGKTGPKRRM